SMLQRKCRGRGRSQGAFKSTRQAMNLSEKQKMLTGQLYLASDAELMAERERAGAWLARYSGATGAERDVLLAEGLGTVGRGVEVRAPFHCDYGYNIHLEDGVFLNFGC